ncbi:uncharacterized protein THITE_48711 [Thermothielavioides terrestris NRRL 8126]|uniref:Protein artemis n=1 Tax=Thermothielavioides terrestris (strain ATCC 38088 / NRRL 8126) TaxID=578455 RepID=G2QRB7_THETT|nr:uncharacterized protein THITE_48711 [Thermothielavioides terrestris NRRL 8126]AEO64169.1 hypothetical protein THITE_48711 [Thermothielavioides terrestris NRRL 8126]
MSTFNGLVAEFPDIRVDYFRPHPELRPPLACFLSHIHSDHLAGLESLRSPLLRYPCRINYANGILEARIQRYRHLRNLLKPIPLDTPTLLELEPGNHIQVTLLDANHCPGAVMFLFEGNGKAVLYTGDVRSEPWFVNSLARSPSLIEYSSGLKTLDTIYLDTSFLDNIEFPTKAEGIVELLQKVSRYPADTIFHFQAWTYGYEDVWIALSKFLQSKIHVDEYKMSMFRSLVVTNPENKFAPSSHLAPEAPGLVGFMCGNNYHAGALTTDENVRLHSCEKGNYCNTVKGSQVVWIRPIITRLPNGQDVAEVGVGGGGDDLERDAELDYLSLEDVELLIEALCDTDNVPDDLRDQVRHFLLSTIANGRRVPLELERVAFGDSNKADLSTGLKAISSKLKRGGKQLPANQSEREALPNVITFPYSRHSSYPELCHLVRTLRPKDVWPCTVDVSTWLREGITVERLFLKHCSGSEFRHDQLMRELGSKVDSQVTVSSASNVHQLSQASDGEPVVAYQSQLLASAVEDHPSGSCNSTTGVESSAITPELLEIRGEGHGVSEPAGDSAGLEGLVPASLVDSQESTVSELALETRFQAFKATLGAANRGAVAAVALLSTTDNHSELEHELNYQDTLR